MIQRKRTYTWNTTIPASPGSFKIGQQPSRVLDGCNVDISLNSKTDPYHGHYSFNITIKKTNPSPITAHILLRLTNIQEEKKSLTDWGVSTCTFEKWPRPSNWASDKSYNFICEITWMIPDPIPRPQSNLHDCMKKFLMSSSYSDVTIVIGKEELPAHKIILAGCSNVFDRMLTAPMKEAQENRIVVKNIDLDVMKTMLTYLYAGEDEALDDVAMAMHCLEAAEKYEIVNLKNLCEHKLLKDISVESVLQIFDHADTYRAEKLKRECLIFIAENKTKIVPTVEFQELCVAKPHLMVQFMATVLTDI